jgi:Flp pilus assembly protein TadG
MKDTMSHRRRHIRSEKGQTMVELALIAPFLFTLLFAIFQFGIIFNNYITLADATRVGARKAAVSRQAVGPAALAEAAARSSASNLTPAKLTIVVTAPVWAPGADVTVEAKYPYEINLLGLIVATGTLDSKTTERIE